MQHVELIGRARALYAAFSGRDWDAFFALADPEVEWTPLDENASYRGRAAISRHFERRLADWVEFRLELESAEASPEEDRVFIAARYEGHVRDSEKLATGALFTVIELRAGRFWRGEEYPSSGLAREAFASRA